MSNQENIIDLGEHQASFDKATGKLSIYDEKQMIHLSADEAYHLLIWMQDHYSDRLYQQALESGSAQHAAAKQISEEEIKLVEEAQVPGNTPAIDKLIREEMGREDAGGEPETESGS